MEDFFSGMIAGALLLTLIAAFVSIRRANRVDPKLETEKGDFVIVYHHWFVSSEGWHTETLRGVTYSEACNVGNAYVMKHSDTFTHVGYKIVQFKDKEAEE